MLLALPQSGLVIPDEPLGFEQPWSLRPDAGDAGRGHVCPALAGDRGSAEQQAL